MQCHRRLSKIGMARQGRNGGKERVEQAGIASSYRVNGAAGRGGWAADSHSADGRVYCFDERSFHENGKTKMRSGKKR